jgi:hypothetical protein
LNKYEIVHSSLSEENLLNDIQIIQNIEEIIQQFNLVITQKSPLSTFKGSTHYHLKMGKLAGVLEVTYWPSKKRLWVEIHENRRFEWNEALIHSFAGALAKCFSGGLEHHG